MNGILLWVLFLTIELVLGPDYISSIDQNLGSQCPIESLPPNEVATRRVLKLLGRNCRKIIPQSASLVAESDAAQGKSYAPLSYLIGRWA